MQNRKFVRTTQQQHPIDHIPRRFSVNGKEIGYTNLSPKRKITRFSFQINRKSLWTDELNELYTKSFLNWTDELYIRLDNPSLSNKFIDLLNTTHDIKNNYKVYSKDVWNGYTLLTDKETFIKIFELLHQFDPLDDYTRMEITFEANIKLIGDNEILSNFGHFLQIAKNLKSSESLWQFIATCETVHFNDLSKLLGCYKSIQPSNPHYEEANDKMLHTLLEFPTNNLGPIKKNLLLEEKFLCALRSGDINKTLTQKLYHELCGNTGLGSAEVNRKLSEKQLLENAKLRREMKRSNVFAKQTTINKIEAGQQQNNQQASSFKPQ